MDALNGIMKSPSAKPKTKKKEDFSQGKPLRVIEGRIRRGMKKLSKPESKKTSDFSKMIKDAMAELKDLGIGTSAISSSDPQTSIFNLKKINDYEKKLYSTLIARGETTANKYAGMLKPIVKMSDEMLLRATTRGKKSVDEDFYLSHVTSFLNFIGDFQKSPTQDAELINIRNGTKAITDEIIGKIDEDTSLKKAVDDAQKRVLDLEREITNKESIIWSQE